MGGHQVLALIPRSSSLFGGARNFFCLTPELIQLALGILQVPLQNRHKAFANHADDSLPSRYEHVDQHRYQIAQKTTDGPIFKRIQSIFPARCNSF